MMSERLSQALGIAFLVFAVLVHAQTIPYERTFPQSKVVVEKAVKELQSSAAGRLPVLDGFAAPGDRPLDRFQRGYYQCTVQVVTDAAGGSKVRVSAKITAWYADANTAKSGYQVLPSNGRLESDFLDQLQDALSKTSAAKSTPPQAPVVARNKADNSAPVISAPQPHDTVPGEPIASSKAPQGTNSPFKVDASGEDLASQKAATDRHREELTKQAKNLEEILHNQSHPSNLAAVIKSGTPVFVSPSEGAKVMFQATAQDEFEILDTNVNWVHIRISGLSRGWIRRGSVELPEGFEASDAPVAEAPSTPAAAPTPAPDSAAQKPFSVENEQIASFPGDWGPLRGKTVKIISVQEAKGKSAETGSKAKLDYAKSLFDREYVELTRDSTLAAGVVLVFDAEDGGMMAATLPVLQQWKSGTLSDEALWRRCYFDPPEMFRSGNTP